VDAVLIEPSGEKILIVSQFDPLASRRPAPEFPGQKIFAKITTPFFVTFTVTPSLFKVAT
jgi:hypothetical protein